MSETCRTKIDIPFLSTVVRLKQPISLLACSWPRVPLVVRRIALFLSRDAASHPRRVFELWMLDCLTIIVDQFTDSAGLPAMWLLTSLLSQIVLYRLRWGSKLYTEVVGRTKVRVLRTWIACWSKKNSMYVFSLPIHDKLCSAADEEILLGWIFDEWDMFRFSGVELPFLSRTDSSASVFSKK